MKKFSKILVVGLVSSLGLTNILLAQATDKLPRSTPEAEGVSSANIIDLINTVKNENIELHSFMFIRHGKVIAEGWWNPHTSETKHILYSASKTFTATAIGLAVAENKLKVTDKVISFFPNSLPENISDYMKEMTVENLLTMSVGADMEPSRGLDNDQIKAFISNAPSKKPGTVFKYNNSATFMLSAIVQQVTGETVFDYLQPRIFKPLGIKGGDWDLNPQGINLGALGLRLKTEDLAKFGQLLLQKGVWNGRQLIQSQWIKEATSKKIENPDGGGSKETPANLNSWVQGYGYQMWRGRDNTSRLDGLGGQLVILVPDQDAVVVFTANAADVEQAEINLLHNYLLPAIKSNKALPANFTAYKELQMKLASLTLKPEISSELPKSNMQSRISEKEFSLSNNSNNIKSVYFSFNNNDLSFTLKRDDNISIIKAGNNNWKTSNTMLSSLLAPIRVASKSTDDSYKILQPLTKVGASYSWIDENTIEITARFVENTLGAEIIVCKFSDINGIVSVSITPKVATGSAAAGMGGQNALGLRGTVLKIN